MRLYSSWLFMLPGISLAAEVGTQTYSTLEGSPTFTNSAQSHGAPQTGDVAVESGSFGMPRTANTDAERRNVGTDGSERQDLKKKFRNRGQCDTASGETFSVVPEEGENRFDSTSGREGEEFGMPTMTRDLKEEQAPVPVPEVEYMRFPPPDVDHDPTPITLTPSNVQVQYEVESAKSRYLAVEYGEGETYQEQTGDETAVERGLGKKKKVAYVSQPMKVAPAPMVVEAPPVKVAPAPIVVRAAPTKAPPAPIVMHAAPSKAPPAPMFIEAAPSKEAPAPMIIEAAPPMKGRYLAAEDDVMLAETEQFDHETATERGLGKKKKVMYVSEPVKMAPPPMKMAPAPMKAHPMIIEAAPTKKGRYLAAEDEGGMFTETEQFEHENASERGLGKKKVMYVSQPMKVAPSPVIREVAPMKVAPAPMVVQAAPTKAPPAPMIVQAAPTKAPPAPMIIEAAPSKEPPAPMIVQAAPSKAPPAPIMMRAAPSKAPPAPMIVQAAPSKEAPEPMLIQAAQSKEAPEPMIIEAAPMIKECGLGKKVAYEHVRLKMPFARMTIEVPPMKMARPLAGIQAATRKKTFASMTVKGALARKALLNP